MQRNFLRGLLICVLPCALFGAFAVVKEYRKGIDLAGGTILIYQVDLEKAKSRQGIDRDPAAAADPEGGLSGEQMQQLAESLKRRIDPADLRNVVIRPLGNSRIEIILPFTPSKKGKDGEMKEAATEDFVQFVKNVVAQVGVLEFRILANRTDDVDAFPEAERLANALTPDEADKLAKAGLPPPVPPGPFRVRIGDSEAEGVVYAWNELGKEERKSLGLNNAAAGSSPLGTKLAAARGKAVPSDGGTPDRETGKNYAYSYLIYSRDFKKENPTKDEADKKVEYFVLTRVSKDDAVRVGGDVSLTARSDQDKNLNHAIGFTFNGAGSSAFGRMTGRNKPSANVIRHLAVILDDKVQTAPTLNSQLSGGGQISSPGGMEKAYVDRMVYILRSGALTAELKPNPVSENTVGSTLGSDTIRKGLMAVVLAFSAVLTFMVFYYRFAGVVACIALFANLLLTVGFMVSVNAAFTLTGLAGIVLMLGMAVDANVLIYERLREEREKGAMLAAALRNGYDRALPTIIDTHLSSIFTAIVLYTFGNDNLKGFSISLTVGLVISLFTSLYMTRLIFDYCLAKKYITQLRFLRLFARPSINFMGVRNLMFTATVISSVLGLGLFLYRGDKVLNVDFTKGTAFGGRLTEALPLSGTGGILNRLSDARQKSQLAVREVYPAQKGEVAAGKDVLTRTYQIAYEGAAAPVTVTLANRPDGATEAEQLADLKRRAAGLPDVSIEQVTIAEFDGGLAEGTTQSFTLRTTEREKELVQVMLNRLLRDDAGKPLLAMVKVALPSAVTGPVAEIAFDKATSESYTKELLAREFDLAYRSPPTGAAFELTGVPSEEGSKDRLEELSAKKFKRFAVNVAKNPEFKGLRDAAAAVPAGAIAGALPLSDKGAEADKAAVADILGKFKAAFEARPVPERLETFDPSMAADTRAKALYAIIASWAAIMMYLWFRFGSWQFGLAAVFCLVHDLCFTLGAIAVCHYLFDLPVFGWTYGFQLRDFKIDLVTVAALLTLVGYSVTDTIVVFDRIREVRGKNPRLTPQMINDSVNQTLSRTVLASLTVMLVAGVLYFFGGEGVHLFGFVMVMGVIVGTYSSIYIASPLLLMFGEGKPPVTVASAATGKQPAGAKA